jgi:hypothetical protein
MDDEIYLPAGETPPAKLGPVSGSVTVTWTTSAGNTTTTAPVATPTMAPPPHGTFPASAMVAAITQPAAAKGYAELVFTGTAGWGTATTWFPVC